MEESFGTPSISPSYFKNLAENLDEGIAIWQLNNLENPGEMRLIFSNAAANRYTQIDMRTMWGKQISTNFPESLNNGIAKQFLLAAKENRTIDLGVFEYKDVTIPNNFFATIAMPLGNLAIAVIFRSVTKEDFYKHKWKEEIEKRLNTLTKREYAVLEKIAESKRSKDIATELGISIKTVDTHRTHIFHKMAVSSSVELIAIFVRYKNI